MTPPLTGFFMKVVGLGEAHKQIEADKRAREDEADIRDFNRRRMHELEEGRHLSYLADIYDRANGTGSHSGSVPRNQHFANGLPISSRSSRDARRAANGPPHSTRGSTLDRQSSPPLPRVHRNDLSLETLAEYELPWHWDKKDKNYIIIELPFSERKLEEFRRHTIRHREQLELNKSAVRGKEKVEKINKVRKSVEPIQAQWEPDRRQERDLEQGSMRGLRDHDRGRARVPQSRAHMSARQADNVRPAPKIPLPIRQVQEVASIPRHKSQSSAGAGLHSRSIGPSSPEEHTLIEQPHQASPHPHRSQHHARHSQAPTEQLTMPSQDAQELNRTGAKLPTAQQGYIPLQASPSIKAPRRHRDQPQTPIEPTSFAPPPRSAGMARKQHGKPAAENTRQLPLRSARGPVQLGRERAPSSMRGSEPRRENPPRSASIARGERRYLAAGTARQFPSQPSRGPVQLGRERAPSSVRGSEPRRGFLPMAGSLFEDGGERGRRRGDTRRFT